MSHPPTTRYVVLQWTQESAQPELAVDDLFTKLIDADDLARDMSTEAKRTGSNTTFTVHPVDMEAVTY